ncbi:MAG: PIN domain-containing protein [Acidobacteria bacterium]|nr:PIN domain-containing protein [Acidobacteriota bacterium]
MSAYLDTHIAVWLHDGLVERLSAEAKKQIEANQLLISPMVLLEFQYLYDRKRIGVEPMALYSYLNAVFGIDLCCFPFPAVAREALSLDWTSDPFDRIIVAQAKSNGESLLVTADTRIRQNYPRAAW